MSFSQPGETMGSMDKRRMSVSQMQRQKSLLLPITTSNIHRATSPAQDTPPPERKITRNRIKGLFLAEFDNTMGPRIAFEANDGSLVPDDVFDAVSDYFITGKALTDHIITVVASGLNCKVMGYPMCIAHHKYDRNALLFNVGFILDISAKLAPYMSPLRKITRTFYSMEMEDEFLSDPLKKERLKEILPHVLKELNERGEFSMVLNDANILALRLLRAPQCSVVIRDHTVPVLTRPRKTVMGIDFDLALVQVVPHIDGIKFAKRISVDAGVDIDIVQHCLGALYTYGCVAFVDIFQYSNTYTIKSMGFQKFLENFDQQEECAQMVQRPGNPRIQHKTLLVIYSKFQPDRTVEQVVLAQQSDMNRVNHRNLITYGVVHNILRRVHCFPVCIKALHSTDELPTVPLGGKGGDYQLPKYCDVQALMDGSKSMDEICVKFMLPLETIEDVARSDGSNILQILK